MACNCRKTVCAYPCFTCHCSKIPYFHDSLQLTHLTAFTMSTMGIWVSCFHSHLCTVLIRLSTVIETGITFFRKGLQDWKVTDLPRNCQQIRQGNEAQRLLRTNTYTNSIRKKHSSRVEADKQAEFSKRVWRGLGAREAGARRDSL